MTQPKNCAMCGDELTGRKFKLEKDVICETCLEKEQEKGNTCPCCNTAIPAGENEVGLVLAMPKSGLLKKAIAPQALAIVCPKCHVIFFDDFNYRTLSTLKLLKETI